MKSCVTLLLLLAILLFGDPQRLCLARQVPPKAIGPHVVLPDPALMKCASTTIWQQDQGEKSPLYPRQIMMDHFDKNGCPQGIVVLYDKSTSVSAIKKAIDQRYGKWAKTNNAASLLNLWRVEPERFAIQLATIRDSVHETGAVGEEGMHQVMYLSFSVANAPTEVQPHPQVR
jgi:hypothetical protein